MKPAIRKLSGFFFLFLLLSIALNARAVDLAFTGKVVGVSDGDTLSVLSEGRTVKVRPHGIDCPQKGQPFGAAAKKFSSDAAFGKEVTVQPKARDRYGRTVAEIILPDGTRLNHQLVSSGLAWWYRKYAPNGPLLQSLEAEARTAQKGLWSQKKPHATLGMEKEKTLTKIVVRNCHERP